MYKKRINTVQDLLDILKAVSTPETTPLVMPDDLKFEYDEEHDIMLLREEPQGNLKLELPPPFDVFNLAHVYETKVGQVKINMYDVVDDNMVMVFADPAFIPDQGPFQIRFGHVVDNDGDWHEIFGLIYSNSVIGYGLHVEAEITEASLTRALEQMLENDADGNPLTRTLQEYHDYFYAVSDLYARSYIPCVEEYDTLWVDMSQRTGEPLYATYSKTPITDDERARVYETNYEGSFFVCTLYCGNTPILKFGSDTLSDAEIEAHVVSDFDYRVLITSDITAAIRTMMYTFEDIVCAG